MISKMDSLWKSNGLDLCMTTYKCVPTHIGASNFGMIQVVMECETNASIQKEENSITEGFLKIN